MCEICGEANKKILHSHHIVERTEMNTDNDDFNLCILCPSCHAKVHDKKLKIIGVYPGTRPPTGRILVYELNGACNIPGLNEPYYVPKQKAMRLFDEEE